MGDPAWFQHVLLFVSSPFIAPLLLSVGVIGLILEIKAGAFGLGGLVSLVSFGLFFGASILTGHAGWQEVILLGLALISLGVEAFILPGFGVAGILGVCFLLGAVVTALAGPAPAAGDFLGALGVLGASLVITMAVFYAWIRHLPNSHRFAGLFHTHASERAHGYVSAPQRQELVGQVGVAVTDLRPSGVAEVNGERIDVVTEGAFVSAGATIVVERAEGYRHVVRATRPVSQLPA